MIVYATNINFVSAFVQRPVANQPFLLAFNLSLSLLAFSFPLFILSYLHFLLFFFYQCSFVFTDSLYSPLPDFCFSFVISYTFFFIKSFVLHISLLFFLPLSFNTFISFFFFSFPLFLLYFFFFLCLSICTLLFFTFPYVLHSFLSAPSAFLLHYLACLFLSFSHYTLPLHLP